MMKRMVPASRVLALAAVALILPACHGDGFFVNINWFVDPAFGDDFNGNGSPSFPFRTITRAMQVSINGDAVFLAPGTYSASSGELFPIFVRPGVLVEGDPGTRGSGPPTTLVSGGGAYTVSGGSQGSSSVTTTFVMGSGSRLVGVKITDAATNGVGVVFDGFSAQLRSCTVTGCASSGVIIYQSGSPTLTDNLITANTGSGVVVFDTAAPSLRTNTITSNGADGVVAHDTSTPDLGNASTAGANTLDLNTGVALNNDTTDSTIQAVGNTWKASTQGSDGSGHYAASLQAGTVAAVAGNNFALTNAAAHIQF